MAPKAHHLYAPPVMTRLYNTVMQMQDAQMTYAALANHRQPHLDCLAFLLQLVLYQQAPAAGIDIPEHHELALLADILLRPLNSDKRTDLLRLVHCVVEGRSNHADTLVKAKVCCHTIVVQSDSTL